MCRWLAYSGSPVALEDVLYKPAHSLIDQSRHSQLGATTTNGDGFGVGWYGGATEGNPSVLRGIGPAWSSRNLREVSAAVRSPLFLAHIRASTGSAVQETNCHPFRYDEWLWMHNGMIAQFRQVKRELVMAVDTDLYPAIEGSTDSEVMFFLALTFGLRDEPPAALARMVGFVEDVGQRNGIANPIQMTIALSDGQRIWSVRYSSQHESRSLFYSTDVQSLRELHPDVEVFQRVSDETRLIVSEPLGELAGAWNAVPESHWGVIQEGDDEIHPFQPKWP